MSVLRTDIRQRLERLRDLRVGSEVGAKGRYQPTELVAEIQHDVARWAVVATLNDNLLSAENTAAAIAQVSEDVEYLLEKLERLEAAAREAEKNLRIIHEANGPVEEKARKMVELEVPCTFDAWRGLHEALEAARDG